MEFSRPEYWSGLPSPSPGDLPHPGIEPGSPTSRSDALQSETPGTGCLQLGDTRQVAFIPYASVSVSVKWEWNSTVLKGSLRGLGALLWVRRSVPCLAPRGCDVFAIISLVICG